jgi:DNA-binding XRE family transcriptional regulator
MATNNICRLRTKAGLSQRKLAALAGTSQQQIQRIEAGVQAARLELALRICSALNAKMEEVFPSAATLLGSKRLEKSPPAKRERDLFKAGIEVASRIWFFKYRLRGGGEDVLKISAADKDLLWNAVQRTDRSTLFVVFDSDEYRVALNLDHLMFCQFLFERADTIVDEADERPDDLIHLVLSDGKALTFEPEADEGSLNDDEFPDDSKELQHLLLMLELSTEKNEVFHFTDVDGETVFFRGADMAMLRIPLWAVVPELLDAVLDDSHEDAEDVPARPSRSQ